MSNPVILERIARNIWREFSKPVFNPVQELNRISRILPTTAFVLIPSYDEDILPDFDQLTIMENEQESKHHAFYLDDLKNWYNATKAVAVYSDEIESSWPTEKTFVIKVQKHPFDSAKLYYRAYEELDGGFLQMVYMGAETSEGLVEKLMSYYSHIPNLTIREE